MDETRIADVKQLAGEFETTEERVRQVIENLNASVAPSRQKNIYLLPYGRLMEAKARLQVEKERREAGKNN
ncbi:MAG: hypothetical protein Q8P12_06215 [bacterium]|nr:hypothetical protein [bacterium]